jgi:hypothetical protein
MPRDDFSEATKHTLAKRVNYHCSWCGCSTTGPGSDPLKVVSIGVAAHITAAAPGGPRFDLKLTRRARVAAHNGIWMCQNHAKLVDSDKSRWTVTQLRKMKARAEREASWALGKSRTQDADAEAATRIIRVFAKSRQREPDGAHKAAGPILVPEKLEVVLRSLIAVGATAPPAAVYCANVLLRNDPPASDPTSDCPAVLAQITFIDRGNALLTINTARWGDTDQPAVRKAKDPFASLIDLNTVPFRIGETHELNIAIKHPEQAWFYAFDNSTYDHPNWDNPAFRLDGTEYHVVVRLRGTHLDQKLHFNLRNLGAGAGLEFSHTAERQGQGGVALEGTDNRQYQSLDHAMESAGQPARGGRSRPAPKEWRRLHGRFEALEEASVKASHRLRDAGTRIYAERPDSDDPADQWAIRSNDPACQRDAELLCALAGARLLSTGIETTLPAHLQSVQDDTQRWLFFLKDLGEARPPDMRMRGSGTIDGTFYALSFDSIDELAKASQRGCVDCERRAATAR